MAEMTEHFRAEKKVIWKTYQNVESLFTQMGVPHAGDWLAWKKESPQSLDQYNAVIAQVFRKGFDEKRNTIRLQPLETLDDSDRSIMDSLALFSAAFFQCKVVVSDSIDFGKIKSSNVSRRSGKQFDASGIMDKIIPNPSATELLGAGVLFREDLYHGKLNFVFGVGNAGSRKGVYSFVRFDWMNERKSQFLLYIRRCLRLLAHELCHILHLPHCIYYLCLMNGSNSLDESDSRPLHLCPLCEDKLLAFLTLHNENIDQSKRYRDLISFFESTGLDEEAEWTKERLNQVDSN